MSAEESRPGGDTETAIKNRADSSHHSTDREAPAPPSAEDEIARLERELAEAQRERPAPTPQAEVDVQATDTAVWRSRDTLIEDAYLEHRAAMSGKQVGLREYCDTLLALTERKIEEVNTLRKAEKLKPLRVDGCLDELIIVRVMLDRYDIKNVNLVGKQSGDDFSQLAIYQSSGSGEGTYATSERVFVKLIGQLVPSMPQPRVMSIIKLLRAHADVVGRTLDAHLIPVNNGIFNHRTKQLLSFDPEYVFLAKSPVDYDPQAESPVITMPDGVDWEIGKWIVELSDDEGVPELLWQIISAALRPGVRWNKAVFLHSSRGNNGKGTFCALLRELVGPDGCASVPIANFSKPFALSELVHARAIITDENSVGAFSKDLGDFKSVITGDAFTLDRKYKDPVSVSFSGLVVQCVNDFPKSRDKSASYTRRQLFVPFRKWFGDTERGYIKQDYLKRPEVLRYVLRVALEKDHEEFSNPAACQDLLEQFQRENSPVDDYWAEFGGQFVWDLLPTTFLYQLFIAWFRETHPAGIPLSRNEFTKQSKDLLADSPTWKFNDCKRPGTSMIIPEPLIAEYELKDWENPSYRGSDIYGKCVPHPQKTNYRGFERRHPTHTYTHTPGDN